MTVACHARATHFRGRRFWHGYDSREVNGFSCPVQNVDLASFVHGSRPVRPTRCRIARCCSLSAQSPPGAETPHLPSYLQLNIWSHLLGFIYFAWMTPRVIDSTCCIRHLGILTTACVKLEASFRVYKPAVLAASTLFERALCNAALRSRGGTDDDVFYHVLYLSCAMLQMGARCVAAEMCAAPLHLLQPSRQTHSRISCIYDSTHLCQAYNSQFACHEMPRIGPVRFGFPPNCSTVYHIFRCMSTWWDDTLLRLDLVGIIAMIFGSVAVGLHNGFYCKPELQRTSACRCIAYQPCPAKRAISPHEFSCLPTDSKLPCLFASVALPHVVTAMRCRDVPGADGVHAIFCCRHGFHQGFPV